MSRTTIKVGKFTVTAGWDRPMNHYFGSIETKDDGDYPYYSTLDDPDSYMGGFLNLDDVKIRLEKIVGKLPEEFWEQAAIKDMNQVRSTKWNT